MSSFFSRIIKLANERNTLDIMNLAFSRAVIEGCTDVCLIHPSRVGGKLSSLGSPVGDTGWE